MMPFLSARGIFPKPVPSPQALGPRLPGISCFLDVLWQIVYWKLIQSTFTPYIGISGRWVILGAAGGVLTKKLITTHFPVEHKIEFFKKCWYLLVS